MDAAATADDQTANPSPVVRRKMRPILFDRRDSTSTSPTLASSMNQGVKSTMYRMQLPKKHSNSAALSAPAAAITLTAAIKSVRGAESTRWRSQPQRIRRVRTNPIRTALNHENGRFENK